MLPKTSPYVKSYDGQTKWVYFSIEDDDLLKKYNAIWNKVSADIKKEFDSEPVNNKEFLKTKKNIMAMKLHHQNYYRQVFLREGKYILKK